jgi:hypothetical protein
MREYLVWVVYEDKNAALGFDRAFEKAAGKEGDGSGWGMGKRDLGWRYKRRDAAERAMGRLKKVGRRKRLRFSTSIAVDENK